jgi:hypothetical protein
VNVSVLVPRRDDGGRRDELWAWTRKRLETLHPEFEIIEGHHDDGPFNRSAAINQAVEQATGDVFVIADSDSFVGQAQLNQAVEVAAVGNQITFAFDQWCYLSRAMSDQIMRGFVGDWTPGVEFTMTNTCSSMVVTPRSLWEQMGGADEGFVGWGGEDIAISLALQTFGGGMKRISGNCWHLHHAPAPRTNDEWPQRMQLYADASYDIEKMRALLTRLRSEA